jgi:hypothetical protein
MVFQGVKLPDREADCLPLSDVEVKDACIRETIHCIHRDDILCAVVGMSVCIFEQLSLFRGVDWIQLAEHVI